MQRRCNSNSISKPLLRWPVIGSSTYCLYASVADLLAALNPSLIWNRYKLLRKSRLFRFKAATIMVAAFLTVTVLLPVENSWGMVRRGQPAPQFKSFSISGQPVSIDGMQGSVLLLDFWATWCPPCRESVPYLAGLHRKYGKQGLVIIGMSVDEGGERVVKEYVEKNSIPYQIVLAGNKVTADYGVRALPVLYLIDKKGQVREFFMGFSAQAGKVIETQVKLLLAE